MLRMSFLIEKAIIEAQKSIYHQRVGAVIFDKKEIISVGHNDALRAAKKLHPRFKPWANSVHAEAAAILSARKNLKGCNILVVRINRTNELRLSEPCSNCMTYLEYVGLKKVYFSVSDNRYIAEIKL